MTPFLLAAAAVSQTFAPYPNDPAGRAETVTVDVSASGPARTFTLASTQKQRENGPQSRTIAEQPGGPAVHSGSPLFDALYAQAVAEARTDSVDHIQDPAYADGKAIACDCFTTGDKWFFVWTRDTSYATDLALARFDPARAATSLLFKTSGFRPGVTPPPELPAGSTQIVQDTGSGGSWPVSTDRVSWALGADAVLAALPAADRPTFAAKALAALTGTIEADRVAAYDPDDGLYTGEQSFLDWRDQTYPAWTLDDLAWLAKTKALSTNVLHYRALRLAARLAGEAGDRARAARYAGWADDLGPRIDSAFWDAKAGLYQTVLTPDGTPLQRYDLLGNALAVLSGVAPPDRARSVVARYPHAPFGPPVYWPEASDQPVYHNRAMWAFVTAYGLRAAVKVDDPAVVNRDVASLMRGAALNLSNMENLEWLTGLAQVADGPVVDSRRQLWSVGAYLMMVEETMFGWHQDEHGATVAPYLTGATRKLLGTDRTATLDGLRFAGRPVSIRLELPAAADDSAVYRVAEVRLNGRRVTGAIAPAQLAAANSVTVRFGAPTHPPAAIADAPPVRADDKSDARAFTPTTPALAVTPGTAAVSLAVTPAGGAQVTRNGTRLADATADAAPPAAAIEACYVARTIGPAGLASFPSQTACRIGAGRQLIAADDPRVTFAPAAAGHVLRLGGTLTVASIAVPQAGRYRIRLRYANHSLDITTGVTNAVKRLTVIDDAGRTSQAIVQMPHQRQADGWSTPVTVMLRAGTATIRLGDFFNMSALASNADYSRPGGASGPLDEATIEAIELVAITK